MGFFSDHPYSAVTAIINKIIENHSGSSDDGTMELELPELLEAINLQNSGATELARALRKKLKYGDDKEKMCSLQILELLVANGGKRLKPLYNDSKLLERFKIIVMDSQGNSKLKKQAVLMVVGWNNEYANNSTYAGLTNLYNQLPMDKFVKRKKKRQLDFMDDEADETTPFEVIGGEEEPQEPLEQFYSSRNYRDRSDDDDDDESIQRPSGPPPTRQTGHKTNQQINREFHIPRINYVKERPKINQMIADSSSYSVKLINSIQSLSPGENPVDDHHCNELFNKCRETRRKILRYLQLVDHEEFLGSLIHANEQLIEALQKYSDLAKKLDDEDDESESDDESELEEESIDISYRRRRPVYSSSESESDEPISSPRMKSPMRSPISSPRVTSPVIKRQPPPVPPKSLALKAPHVASHVAPVEDDDPFGDNQKTEYPVLWS